MGQIGLKKIILGFLSIKIIYFLERTFLKKKNGVLIQNINWNPLDEKQPRVLISYVADPFVFDFTNQIKNTRGIECAVILKEFINKGYCVDLIDNYFVKPIDLLISKKYDLIFGFGNVFRELSGHVQGKKIIYLTEKFPSYSLQKEKERVEYYRQRYDKSVELSRSNLYYKESDFDIVDAIVFIGNNDEKDLIPISIPKFSIKPTGLNNNKYFLSKRNISFSKKNFIWFGSRGVVHKGLDILIDVFKDIPSCNLYIAGLSQVERKILPDFSTFGNIFDLGFVDVYSDKFLTLINTVSFVILPSCSEGISTGVITCMNHGLIPVVTRETGIDTSLIGYELSDFKVEYLKNRVLEISNIESELIDKHHDFVFNYAKSTFSLDNFQNTFSRILAEL